MASKFGLDAMDFEIEEKKAEKAPKASKNVENGASAITEAIPAKRTPSISTKKSTIQGRQKAQEAPLVRMDLMFQKENRDYLLAESKIRGLTASKFLSLILSEYRASERGYHDKALYDQVVDILS